MDVNLNIEENDINYIKDFLKGKKKPVELDALVYELALYKTMDKREDRVKLYNPNCEYKIGDLIYKDYPGKIPVGAKKYIEIDRGVVLKVDNTRTRFGLEEIILKYEGTSDFKRYTDYLERQKIELLLPHKQKKPCEKMEYIPEENDPRKKQDPLVKKDFLVLKKKLYSMLNREDAIAFICEKVLLKENMQEIKPDIFNRIKEFLKENKKSEKTDFLVENFINVKAGDAEFDAFCFALNFRMKNDYKIDFQQTTSIGWGKWNLISVIYYLKKSSIVSDENPLSAASSLANKKNLGQKRKKLEESIFDNENSRYYLTQREIYSGALKLKPGAYHFSDSIEIEAIDSDTKKSYLLYYYSDANLILGFKEVFDRYKALQGMSLIFEQTGEDKFQFSLRTTKKGTIADKISFNSEKKTFQVSEEKIASPVFVNKSIFLESDVFKKVDEKVDEFRKIPTFNKLVHKIFLDFGIKEKNYEIHLFRLYHILDLIFPVQLKMVEDVVLSNPEFIQSEKIPGIFYLDSDAVIEIEEEERKRRDLLIEEVKEKREKIRLNKIQEEQKLKEEIRLKREEHRKKREEDMWMKEKLKKEREKQKTVEPRVRKGMESVSRPGSKRVKRADYKTEGVPGAEMADLASDRTGGRKEYQKKFRKKVDVEKPLISKKRVEKKAKDEELDIDEIKSEIKLEELKEKVLEKKEVKKKPKEDKEIAYKDDGGFGGILASKLEEIEKKKDKKKDKASKK